MKAKTKLTRLCSILLSLVLLVGLLPTVALAAGSATATADFVSDPTTALALLNDAKTGTTKLDKSEDVNSEIKRLCDRKPIVLFRHSKSE